MKKEAKFTTSFASWANRYIPKPAVFELKQTSKDSLPFDSVKEHQEIALLSANEKGFPYKISDQDRRYKPFDLCLFGKQLAFVAIQYPTCWTVIGIKSWKNLKTS